MKVAGGEFNFGLRTDAWYTSDPTSGTSFISGGGGDPTTDNTIPPGGMIIFDSSDPSNISWRNDTTGSNRTSPTSIEGQMVYVRSGKQGVLLGIGGFNVRGFMKSLLRHPH